MPVFDYQCTECGVRYDVYHKVREVADDVICPSCGSKNHKRLMSVPAASAGSHRDAGAESFNSQDGSCNTCCNNGMCGIN